MHSIVTEQHKDETPMNYSFTSKNEFNSEPIPYSELITRQGVIYEMDRIFKTKNPDGFAIYHLNKSISFDFKIMINGYPCRFVGKATPVKAKE